MPQEVFFLVVKFPMDALDKHLQKEDPLHFDGPPGEPPAILKLREGAVGVPFTGGQIRRAQAWAALEDTIKKAAGQQICDSSTAGELRFQFADETVAYVAQRNIQDVLKQPPFSELGISLSMYVDDSE